MPQTEEGSRKKLTEKHVVGFGLFMEFVDKKEYTDPYHLNGTWKCIYHDEGDESTSELSRIKNKKYRVHYDI